MGLQAMVRGGAQALKDISGGDAPASVASGAPNRSPANRSSERIGGIRADTVSRVAPPATPSTASNSAAIQSLPQSVQSLMSPGGFSFAGANFSGARTIRPSRPA